MRTTFKSFLMLLAVVLLVPQGVKAQEYDFKSVSENSSADREVTMSTSTDATYTECYYFSKIGTLNDPGRFASEGGWSLFANNQSRHGLQNLSNKARKFLISGLGRANIVTFEISEGSITLESDNATQNGNTITMKSGGVLAVSCPNRTNITKISIAQGNIQSNVYNYDPAIEIYDLSGQNGTTYSTSDAGFPLGVADLNAMYLTNLNSGLSLNNRIAISQGMWEGNAVTFQWSFDGGLKADYAWHNVSICNLKEGDRVRISYQGNAVFSSKENTQTYNGCPAFKDVYNDGELNEEDVAITGGTTVENYFYVITEDGHLDIGLSSGSKITKIEIYSDHQAVMLDKYNGSAATGYTAYFESTGQLMAKEHVVPGGLNVYVGNSDETQHAEVVMSDRGPVSFVYDYEHFKMARQSDNGTNVEAKAPTTGTFYKFMPEVDGYMTVNFKAYNIKYNQYSNVPGVHGTDPGNEVVMTSGTCPYYIMVKNSSNQFSRYQHPNGNTEWGHDHSTGDNGGFTNFRVTAGNTYYVYGWWSKDSNGVSPGTDGWRLEDSYCGVAELIDVTFIPDNMVTPLAKWVESGTEEDDDLADVTGYTTSDLHIKKMSNNITNCEPYIYETTVNGQTVKKLGIRNITFADGANPGGTILIKLGSPSNDANPVFAYTIAYDASWNNGQGHTWDFSTYPLKGLKWTNTSGQADAVNFSTSTDQNGLLYQEMHETNPDGTPHSDWTYSWRVKKGDTVYDPMFLNKYDMEGDNADMMWDTEGLIINTASNQSAINNEYTGNVSYDGGTLDVNGIIDHETHEIPNTNPIQYYDINRPDPDRYVGILPGGEFRIPQLMKDDRVIIYMGSGDGSGVESVFMNIENARDAVYAEIDPEDEYHIGGSLWNANSVKTTQAHGDPYYRGCYHFFATGDPDDEDKPADMVFKLLNKGTLVKLYSIEIYHGNRRGTNGVNVKERNVDSYIFVSDKDDTQGKTNRYNLHYLGKGEYPGNCEIIAHSGSITNNVVSANGYDVSYTSNVGDFGDIRVRVKDLEMNKKYVADYADRNLTIGYKDKVDSYPYTWDFTDIKGFSSTLISNDDTEFTHGNTEIDAPGRDLSLWDANGCMIIREEGYNGANDQQYEIFQQNKYGGGNQLWAYDKIIPETKGLWFYFDNNDGAYNGSMKIATEGLHLACTNDGIRRGWWNYKMIVPDVPEEAAVYLRMARDENVKTDDVDSQGNAFFHKKFQFGWMSAKADMGTERTDICKYYQATDGTGDYIVAIKNTGEESNLTFTLNGWVLKKMSVATDEKTVNKLGWNTESRERAIDPSLLPYMTGMDFRTYVVTEADEEKNSVLLQRIDGVRTDENDFSAGNIIVPAATNGSINACIIYNHDGAEVDMFGTGSGFHLFVPDMHETTEAIPTSNLLKAQVTAITRNEDYIPRTASNGNANYAFNYVYKKTDESGNTTSGSREGEQAFYRIVATGAKSGANKAYLSVPPVSSSRALSPTASTSQPAESYSIRFLSAKDVLTMGDVNADGSFNKLDVNAMADRVAGRPTSVFIKSVADMNDDGAIDIVDLTLMIKKITGK